MKAGDLSVGEFIRSPKSAKKIFRVSEVRSYSSILIREYDPFKKEEVSNSFMFIKGGDEVDKVTL